MFRGRQTAKMHRYCQSQAGGAAVQMQGMSEGSTDHVFVVAQAAYLNLRVSVYVEDMAVAPSGCLTELSPEVEDDLCRRRSRIN